MLFLGKKLRNNEKFAIKTRDLRTHGICVGMTGSGKTGLCIDMLEELRLSKTPTIVIDPKGDMTNLLLAFEKLSLEDFAPWIDPAEASSKGVSISEYSSLLAEKWRTGLSKDGIEPERIAEMKANSPATLFTPGSTAGTPINILSGLENPDMEDMESANEHIKTVVGALLDLAKVKSDPITGPEFILLSNLLHYCYENKQGVTLERLIAYIQTPPIKRLGVFAVDKFIPQEKRNDLALSLNALMASPSFSTWMAGDPLSIPHLLHTKKGKPRCSIIYLAHLNDAERQFCVSLLLSRIWAWAKIQPGSESLRLLVYIDEAAGLLPPLANPPTKQPIITMFKQGRAFGMGLFITTQNPMDVDYKSMSNAGLWMVGKLNTTNDQKRIINGMKGAANAPENLPALLSSLGKREFFVRNIHSKIPESIKSRWAMSYLKGPMTKGDIKILYKDKPRAEIPTKNKAPAGLALAPKIKGIRNLYLDSLAFKEPEIGRIFPRDTFSNNQRVRYRPGLIVSCQVRYDDTKSNLLYDEVVTRILFPLDGVQSLDPLSEDSPPMPDITPYLTDSHIPDAVFDNLPVFLDDPAEINSVSIALSDFCYRRRGFTLFSNKELKMFSRPGESKDDFLSRIIEQANEQAGQELEKVQKKLVGKIERLERKRRKIERRIGDAEEESHARQRETTVNILESAAGFLFGRRRSFGRAVSGNLGKRRMAKKAERRVDGYEGDLEAVNNEIDELHEQIGDNEDSILARYEEIATMIEPYPVPAERNDIRRLDPIIIWVPCL